MLTTSSNSASRQSPIPGRNWLMISQPSSSQQYSLNMNSLVSSLWLNLVRWILALTVGSMKRSRSSSTILALDESLLQKVDAEETSEDAAVWMLKALMRDAREGDSANETWWSSSIKRFCISYVSIDCWHRSKRRKLPYLRHRLFPLAPSRVAHPQQRGSQWQNLSNQNPSFS